MESRANGFHVWVPWASASPLHCSFLTTVHSFHLPPPPQNNLKSNAYLASLYFLRLQQTWARNLMRLKFSAGHEASRPHSSGLLGSTLSRSRLYLVVVEYLLTSQPVLGKGWITLFLRFLSRSQRCEVHLLSRPPVAQWMLQLWEVLRLPGGWRILNSEHGNLLPQVWLRDRHWHVERDSLFPPETHFAFALTKLGTQWQ